MLCLTRKLGQRIYIGQDIEIVLIEIKDLRTARLGILAPQHVQIVRDDAIEKGRREHPRRAAADDFRRDIRWCRNCKRHTSQICRDSKHARDSLADHQECTVCHWCYSGLTGEWSPPQDATDNPPPANTETSEGPPLG